MSCHRIGHAWPRVRRLGGRLSESSTGDLDRGLRRVQCAPTSHSVALKL